MARIETRDDEPQIPVAPVGPPRGDEGLDDWFTRRLEAQGINAGRGGFPTARVISVVALAVAVGALLWVLSGASGSSSSDSASTVTHTQSTATTPTNSTTGGSTTTGGTAPAIPWQQVKVTVLNGTGTQGAAADAKSTLSASGWNIVGTGNVDSGSSFATTEVVYPPGKKAPAQAVATKLGLGAPVAAADATGVPSDLATVAIVLGSDGLPSTA